MPQIRAKPFLLLVFIAFGLAACSALISPFSETAYRNATSLKAESLALIAKSSEPYAQHRVAAEKLAVDVDAAFEYANGIPRNGIVACLLYTSPSPRDS